MCLDQSSGHIYVSRHVLFYERVYPFANQSSISQQLSSCTSQSQFLPHFSPKVEHHSPTSYSSSPIDSNISIDSSNQSHPISSSSPTNSPMNSLSISSTSQNINTHASTSDPIPSSSNTNTHAMTTGAKAGVYKPKIFLIEYINHEPPSLKIALQRPH